MSRNKKITKKQFVRAYNRAKSAKSITKALHISLPSVYIYIERYKLPLFGGQRNRVNPLRIAEKYWGGTSVNNLAKELSQSPQNIRNHLRKIIWYPEEYSLTGEPDSEDYLPPPKKIIDIRIINTITKFPECLEYPVMLTRHGIKKNHITDYWKHAFKSEPDFMEPDDE